MGFLISKIKVLHYYLWNAHLLVCLVLLNDDASSHNTDSDKQYEDNGSTAAPMITVVLLPSKHGYRKCKIHTRFLQNKTVLCYDQVQQHGRIFT